MSASRATVTPLDEDDAVNPDAVREERCPPVAAFLRRCRPVEVGLDCDGEVAAAIVSAVGATAAVQGESPPRADVLLSPLHAGASRLLERLIHRRLPRDERLSEAGTRSPRSSQGTVPYGMGTRISQPVTLSHRPSSQFRKPGNLADLRRQIDCQFWKRLRSLLVLAKMTWPHAQKQAR